MQILSVQMKNIKSHRDKEYTFSSGINVLSGPNGIGKSTIFEAVGYALFGVDARDFVGNIDRFVTIGEKRGEVKVVFQPGDDDIYQASRTVGANSKWLLARKIGEDFEVGCATRDVNMTGERLRFARIGDLGSQKIIEAAIDFVRNSVQ